MASTQVHAGLSSTSNGDGWSRVCAVAGKAATNGKRHSTDERVSREPNYKAKETDEPQFATA